MAWQRFSNGKKGRGERRNGGALRGGVGRGLGKRREWGGVVPRRGAIPVKKKGVAVWRKDN
jgi:hypothetical protein